MEQSLAPPRLASNIILLFHGLIPPWQNLNNLLIDDPSVCLRTPKCQQLLNTWPKVSNGHAFYVGGN